MRNKKKKGSSDPTKMFQLHGSGMTRTEALYELRAGAISGSGSVSDAIERTLENCSLSEEAIDYFGDYADTVEGVFNAAIDFAIAIVKRLESKNAASDKRKQEIDDAVNESAKTIYGNVFMQMGYPLADSLAMADRIVDDKESIDSVIGRIGLQLEAEGRGYSSEDQLVADYKGRNRNGREKVVRSLKARVVRKCGALTIPLDPSVELPLAGLVGAMTTGTGTGDGRSSYSYSDDDYDVDVDPDPDLGARDIKIEKLKRGGKTTELVLTFKSDHDKLIAVSEVDASNLVKRFKLDDTRFGYYEFSDFKRRIQPEGPLVKTWRRHRK